MHSLPVKILLFFCKLFSNAVFVGFIAFLGLFVALCSWLFPSPLSQGKTTFKEQVKGISTLTKVSPTPINICNATAFISEDWNLSHYHESNDGYYLPNETTKRLFWYPPITYKNPISGIFKEISVVYEDTYQSEISTSSATLLMSVYDDNSDEVLEVDAPEPNRQLIGFKVIGNFSDEDKPIAPVSLDPFILNKQVAYTGTNTISIKTTTYNKYDHTITYHIAGNFTDHEGNPELMFKDITVKLPTSDPTLKLFKLIIGTGIGAKLKIKNVTICDG